MRCIFKILIFKKKFYLNFNEYFNQKLKKNFELKCLITIDISLILFVYVVN